jgi:hypothetical protein
MDNRQLRGGCGRSAPLVESLESRTLLSELTTAAASTAPAGPVPTADAATAQPPTAEVLLPQMPTSDNWYGAIVNANHYVSPSYLTNLPAKLSLITDLRGDNAALWAQAVALVQATHPQTLIGTYHSSRDAQLTATMNTYPRRAVPKEGLTADQLLMQEPGYPDAWVVDYRQPAARQYLVDTIVQDVVQTGRPLAFLDNVSHDESGFPIPWATTMDLVHELTTRLHEQGKPVIINAAWVPGITSMDSVDQLIATGVDGVSLEMAFHANVRGDVSLIQTAMQEYRRMLDAGLTVIFIPTGTETGGAATIENIEAEQRLQAAYGMMFRQPGDRLFVNELFFRPTPDWGDWTTRFGLALGDATITANVLGEIVLSRSFTHDLLTANVATKEVTDSPA